MWTMTDYKSPIPLADGRKYLSSKNLNEYDCVEIKIRLVIYYPNSKNMGTGGLVYTQQYDGEWQDILPNSIGMLQWEVACKK